MPFEHVDLHVALRLNHINAAHFNGFIEPVYHTFNRICALFVNIFENRPEPCISAPN